MGGTGPSALRVATAKSLSRPPLGSSVAFGCGGSEAVPLPVVLGRRRLQIGRQLALGGVQQIDQVADLSEHRGELLVLPVVVIDVLLGARRSREQGADPQIPDMVGDMVHNHPPVRAALKRPPPRSRERLDALRRRAPQLLRRLPAIAPRDQLARLLQQPPAVDLIALNRPTSGVRAVGSHRTTTLTKRREPRARCRPLCHNAAAPSAPV